MLGMTAAHPTLPLPSYVRVTNVRNGRSVIVRVNDRGPFKHDRVIDLSYAAAAKLGIAAVGTGEVEIERITVAQIASGDYRRGSARCRAWPPHRLRRARRAETRSRSRSQSRQPCRRPPSRCPSPLPGRRSLPRCPSRRRRLQQRRCRRVAGQFSSALLRRSPTPMHWPGVRRRYSHSSTAPRISRHARRASSAMEACSVCSWVQLSDRDSALSLARELERLLERPATVLLR